MLSPQTLHDLPNEMVDLVNEVQEDILRSIAKKLVKADYLTPSAEWQLYKAAIYRRLQRGDKQRCQDIPRVWQGLLLCSKVGRVIQHAKCRYQKRRRNDKKSLPLYGGFLARYRNASYGQGVA